MPFENLLDFAGVHVVAAADDQLLHPPGDRVVPVLADPPQVLRAKPSVFPEDLFCRVGPVPVPLEDMRAAHLDLPDLAGRQGLTSFEIHHPRLLAGERATYST